MEMRRRVINRSLNAWKLILLKIHVGKQDLYAGILMVHIKLAKLTGVSATFPPAQETVYQLFDECDTTGSGGITREEFDIFLSASSVGIFGRIFINLITYIFVIPYYSKVRRGKCAKEEKPKLMLHSSLLPRLASLVIAHCGFVWGNRRIVCGSCCRAGMWVVSLFRNCPDILGYD